MGVDALAVDTLAVEQGLLRLRVDAVVCRELAAASRALGGRLRAVEVAAALDAFSGACAETFGLLGVDLELVAGSLAAAALAYDVTEATAVAPPLAFR